MAGLYSGGEGDFDPGAEDGGVAARRMIWAFALVRVRPLILGQ